MITKEQMYEITRRYPFVPVRLHMSDGRTFDITRPWAPGNMLIRKEWLSLGVFLSPTDSIADYCEYIYLPWVERVEELARRPAMNDFAFQFAVTG